MVDLINIVKQNMIDLVYMMLIMNILHFFTKGNIAFHGNRQFVGLLYIDISKLTEMTSSV
jgi:hypothetical protein